jgi:hypothetical protein
MKGKVKKTFSGLFQNQIASAVEKPATEEHPVDNGNKYV